jgi:hypothetical protein
MKCVIMQPTYLPWAGYFNLISQADVFVFLDDGQYERSSWQNRNRVLANGKAQWLTVPALRLELSQTFNTVQVDDKRGWRQKHFRLIEQTYGNRPQGREILDVVRVITDPAVTGLVDLNTKLILEFSRRLDLTPRFVRSSEIGISGQRSERLLRICEHFGCDEYLSPNGAAEYLARDKVFDDAPVKLSFQQFAVNPYPQNKNPVFVESLSIVDVVANLGWIRARDYVLGRYSPTLEHI